MKIINEGGKHMRSMKYLLGLLLVLGLIFSMSGNALASTTTADVTINATPSYISISNSPSTYAFGALAESATANTTTSYFTVTNGSSVTTNTTIQVTGSTWTGGTAWTHSDTATPGADTVGLKASKNTGAYDVIVKASAAFEVLAPNQAATTNFQWELKIYAPTSFSDGVIKSNTVRLTMAAV